MIIEISKWVCCGICCCIVCLGASCGSSYTYTVLKVGLAIIFTLAFGLA